MKLLGIACTLTAVIYLISIVPPEFTSINGLKIGERTRIIGEVKQKIRFDKTELLTVKDFFGTIKVIIFQKTRIKKGDWIIVTGRVEEYKGEKEIKASTVTVI